MKGNHYKKNPFASRSYTHTFKAAADAAPLPFSSALVAAELRNMHLASCEFMRFTPYMRFVPRNLETSQDFSGLYYLMGVHPPPGLTLTFPRATRCKGTYRSIYVGIQNDEPL